MSVTIPAMERKTRSLQGRHRDRYSAIDRVQNCSNIDAIPGQDKPLGARHFGKARVNCCLRGDYCKWGRLNGKETVVLQLLTDPRQESGFKLDTFTLELSFTEHDPNLHNATPANGVLRLLEPPSPKYLKGDATTQHRGIELTLAPQVTTGPAGVQLGQVKWTSDRDVKKYWVYHSHWNRDEHDIHTIAEWIWQANRHNPQVEDVAILYSGLILQHPCRPFWVGCKIRGQLVPSTKMILNAFRFKYGHKDDERPTFTKILTRQSSEDLQDVVNHLDDEITNLICGAAASKSISPNTVSCSKPLRICVLMTRVVEIIRTEYESPPVS